MHLNRGLLAGLVFGLLMTFHLVAAEDRTMLQELTPEEDAKISRAPVHASLLAYPNAVIKADDKASGITVEVKLNGKDLEAKKADKVLWTVTLPKGDEIGTPVIRNVTVANGKVDAVIGKHRYVTLDLNSGKVLSDGSD